MCAAFPVHRRAHASSGVRVFSRIGMNFHVSVYQYLEGGDTGVGYCGGAEASKDSLIGKGVSELGDGRWVVSVIMDGV